MADPEGPEDPQKPSGFNDGDELVSPDGAKERIVHEIDADGHVSWHKEVVA